MKLTLYKKKVTSSYKIANLFQMHKIWLKLPCGRDDESHNNNGYESAASFSLGHVPNGGVTKHLLQRRVNVKE